MSLNIIIGPMKAGKTDDIIRTRNKFLSIGKNVLVVNHVFDSQRNKENSVTTHSGKSADALSTISLLAIINDKNYQAAQVVIVDESQFFYDLETFIRDQLRETDKHFFVYGLAADINNNKFGQILDIIPIADTIKHLTAYCVMCKDTTPAPFTRSDTVLPSSQVHIGDDIFSPVCRRHYYSPAAKLT